MILHIFVFTVTLIMCLFVRWIFGIDLFERGFDAGLSLAVSVVISVIALVFIPSKGDRRK